MPRTTLLSSRRQIPPARLAVPILVLACALCVVPVSAQDLTLDQAIRTAQRQVPGKLVAATTERRGEQTVYRIRILGADGVVRTVVVDAKGKP